MTDNLMSNDTIVSSVGMSPEQQQFQNILSNFFVVELHFSGLGYGKRKMEDHLLTAVFRLGKKHRNQMQYMKVQFYRLCDKYASFHLERKYVIPRRKLNEFEQHYREIETDFKQERKNIYNELTHNWPSIAADIRAKFPSLPITDKEIEDLKPTSIEFVTMDYEIRPMTAILEELKGMEQVMQASNMTGVAQRVGGQYQSLMATVQEEYQKKVKDLEETIVKMKEALAKKSKKAEKLKLRAQELGEDAQDMVEILGEPETMKSKLEAMMEELAE